MWVTCFGTMCVMCANVCFGTHTHTSNPHVSLYPIPLHTDTIHAHPNLFRDSPDGGEPFPEHHKDPPGPTPEGGGSTVKGGVPGTQNDH